MSLNVRVKNSVTTDSDNKYNYNNFVIMIIFVCTHTHIVLMAIFPDKPVSASCSAGNLAKGFGAVLQAGCPFSCQSAKIHLF